MAWLCKLTFAFSLEYAYLLGCILHILKYTYEKDSPNASRCDFY